jgi:CubicO group peptidase (beta-lactamase class C family)
MKNKVLLAGVAVAIGITAMQGASAGKLQAPPGLERQIPQLMQKMRIPGLAIAKIEDGEIAWQAAFGERAPGKPVATDTVFNAASLTKPVFATMALHLVANEGLGLDEGLHKHWIDPDVAEDVRHQALTPRIVLSHQGGLPNWRGNRELGFMFEPGARHEYSGEGYEYLRQAIENKSGREMQALVQEQVFGPASMKRSALSWSDDFADNYATGFNEAGEAIDTYITKRRPNAAAHLMTTVGDYARFAAWVSKGAELPAALFDEMRRPQALHEDPAERFGLGWKLIPVKDGEALMHDGREPGVRTYAIVLPNGEALVILTNSSNGELSFRPLVKAALADGDAIMQSADRLVWNYLVHLPPQALVPMSRGIARSPTFLATMLYAVDTVLMQTSSLSAADKAAASKAVDPYVFALLNGDIEPAQAEKLIELLLIQDGDAMRLVTKLDAKAARAWLQALNEI